MRPANRLPQIAVSCTDYNELIVALGVAREEEGAIFLKRELQRAAIYHPDDLPGDVVTLNSRVIFHVENESAARARLLVHPNNLLCPMSEESALSPIGAALLGLRPGDVMPFVERGQQRELSVEAVGMRFVGNGVPRLKPEPLPAGPARLRFLTRSNRHA